MATLSKQTMVKATVEQVWDAIRDIGALHTRLVPGFVLDTKLEPTARVVTFANGSVVRERIVSIDDHIRRLVWSATEDLLTHHNASVQVFEDDEGRTRITWIADRLPDSLAGTIDQMMDDGISAMQIELNRLSLRG